MEVNPSSNNPSSAANPFLQQPSNPLLAESQSGTLPSDNGNAQANRVNGVIINATQAPSSVAASGVLPLALAATATAAATVGTNAAAAAAAAANPKPARELKVEDALLYLDQVKVEFTDKPHIYNEFLDIMKNFKAQSINTPGVIERVKNLFKGYNKLILGFNTFLPEGEGYKIELTPEEQAYQPEQNEHVNPSLAAAMQATAAAMSQQAEANASRLAAAAAPPSSAATALQAVPTVAAPQPAGPASSSASALPGVALAPSVAPNGTLNNAAVPPNAATAAAPGQMQQAHAIHYVTKIRNRFSQEPETYRQFLKILHTYQKEQKGIKEVLEQVSQLFADHSDLLMEFTYFLPDAVQDQAKERLERAARESEARKSAKMQAQKPKKGSQYAANNQMGNMMMGFPGQAQPGAPGMMGGNMIQPMDLNGNMQGNRDGNGGNKRSREPKVASHLLTGQHPVLSQNYAVHLAAAGMEDVMQPNKKQNVGAGNLNAALATGPGGLPMMQPAKKQNRRKNQNNATGNADPNSMVADALVKNFGAAAAPIMAMGLAQQSNQMMSSQFAQSQAQMVTAAAAAQRNRDSHLSISAERRFFDQVKDVLLAISRDSWSDFVKCLDMFTNDAIPKEEMLEVVGDLLGPSNGEIFGEFKRLLENRSDYQERKEDMWFSVPLSEIDYSQCRKCTPSYRALPRDYPKPKCTERNEEEEKVLNDVWVSIPIGSEESYSFKHMRKNQYEEALFKCEDERFEIDMVIDSNMSTIRILEPLEQEIAQLKTLVNKKDNTAGATGPRFSLQLEKRHLSTIHLNAIARIYGDHGEEILELLRKNPAGTIPVVLKRLRQKDTEWKKARQEMNKQWKDILDKNHYKSFDHRSFYFRQHDKKYLSTKQLVSEISAPLDPNASREDRSIAGISNAIDDQYVSLMAGIEPQLVLRYDHDAHLIHRDIYRIVCHAAETTITSVNDRERLAALWRDLIRVFFNVPAHYLYSTASSASPVTDHDTFHPVSSEAWLVNTKVITAFGSGTVESYRESDGMYCVKLGFGKAFLNASSIYGAEQLPPQALYAVGVTVDKNGKDVIYNGLVHPSSQDQDVFVKDPSKLFFGTQMCYVFLRLHHALYVRLRTASQLAREAIHHSSNPNRTFHTALVDEADEEAKLVSGIDKSKPVYNHFLSQVFAMIEGTIDNNRFEDFSRTLLGNKSYVLYTLDKIVSQMMKHLQAMTNDDNVTKLIGLFVYHHNHDNVDGVDVELYKSHVAHILSHTMEDVFRMQLFCPAAGIMAEHSEVAIQHLGVLTVSSTPAQIAAALASAGSAELGAVPMDVDGPMDVVHEEGGIRNRMNSFVAPQGEDPLALLNSSGTTIQNKVPKAVVSDEEEDDDEEDEDGEDDDEDADAESAKASIDDDISDRKLFSPRNNRQQ